MKKHTVIIFIVVVITVIIYAVIIHSNIQNSADLPRASIEIISDVDYLEAFKKNEANPIRDDYYAQVTYPKTESTFYKIMIRDKGYSKDLPIDLEIFFAIDTEGLLLKDSYFCTAEMSASQRYANIFVGLDNSSPEIENVYLSINISVIGRYDDEGRPYQSIPYKYHAFGFFDIITLKTIQFDTT